MEDTSKVVNHFLENNNLTEKIGAKMEEMISYLVDQRTALIEQLEKLDKMKEEREKERSWIENEKRQLEQEREIF